MTDASKGSGLIRVEKFAHAYLGTPQKDQSTVVLTDVLKLNAGGFKEGNIILEVSTREPEEVTLHDVEKLYELDASREPAAWEHQLMGTLKEQRLAHFRIESFLRRDVFGPGSTNRICGGQG